MCKRLLLGLCRSGLDEWQTVQNTENLPQSVIYFIQASYCSKQGHSVRNRPRQGFVPISEARWLLMKITPCDNRVYVKSRIHPKLGTTESGKETAMICACRDACDWASWPARERIEALKRIIPRRKVKEILSNCGAQDRGCRRLPGWSLVWFVVALGLFSRDSYRPVFRWPGPFRLA